MSFAVNAQHCYTLPTPPLLTLAPLRVSAHVACAALQFVWMVHFATTRCAVLLLQRIFILSVCFVQQKTWNFLNYQTGEMRACAQSVLHCKLSLCYVMCSQTFELALSCTHFILYSRCFGWVVGGWVFLPALLLALFLFTLPPTTAQKQHKCLHFFFLAIPPALTCWGLESPPSSMREKMIQRDPDSHIDFDVSLFLQWCFRCSLRHVRSFAPAIYFGIIFAFEHARRLFVKCCKRLVLRGWFGTIR